VNLAPGVLLERNHDDLVFLLGSCAAQLEFSARLICRLDA